MSEGRRIWTCCGAPSTESNWIQTTDGRRIHANCPARARRERMRELKAEADRQTEAIVAEVMADIRRLRQI
jgi:hypothetical protein